MKTDQLKRLGTNLVTALAVFLSTAAGQSLINAAQVEAQDASKVTTHHAAWICLVLGSLGSILGALKMYFNTTPIAIVTSAAGHVADAQAIIATATCSAGIVSASQVTTAQAVLNATQPPFPTTSTPAK